ncbi:MAG: hypothetical protein FWG91_11235 [Lachnospiraceae bacterium]|nr:hypothetical protein [Lachnospiraceae bacterium]
MSKKIIAIAIFITLLSGCSLPAEPEDTLNAEPDEQVQSLVLASWADSYPDIKTLAKDSDFIGIVEITGEADRIIVPDGVDTNKGDAYTIPLTVFSARVIEGIISDEQELHIVMTGKTGVMAIADDPLLKPGEIWMIFADRNENNTYAILGGPQGRFYYDETNGTISQLSAVIHGSKSPLAELKLADVKEEIERLN